ncbi:MAG TPA: glycosyltransferase family 2 protein [Candidatus Krumholzibacteria bacterium]|nr:glycosyltransferase family 2 protein [Candidatus Krumholzibacteria bacterium]
MTNTPLSRSSSPAGDSGTAAPRVSIGLPVYNGDAFLADAIDTLLAQTYRDFELIISDNASTDGTEAICRERAARDPRIRYVRHATNQGAMRNFNVVVEMARGEYFKWAAHDDMHEPTHVQRCVEALDRHADVVLACTKLIDIDDDGRRKDVDVPHLRWDSSRPNVRFRALANPHHRCESVFGVMRTRMLRATPLLGDYAGCDRVLLAEISLAGKFYEVPEILFLHREHQKRSTKEYKSEQTRGAWFNPALAGRPDMPHVRMLRGYRDAIRRAHVPWWDKFVCTCMLIPWSIRNRPGLWKDVRYSLAYLLSTRHRPST